MTKLVINNAEEFSAYYDNCCANPPSFPLSIELKEIGQKQARTIPQNNALHLYFQWLSETLSASGLDVMKTLRHNAAIPWNPDLIKSLIWSVMQKAMFDTTSTAKLDREGVSAVYDVINRHLIEKHNVHVDFPDSERLRLNQIYGRQQ